MGGAPLKRDRGSYICIILENSGCFGPWQGHFSGFPVQGFLQGVDSGVVGLVHFAGAWAVTLAGGRRGPGAPPCAFSCSPRPSRSELPETTPSGCSAVRASSPVECHCPRPLWKGASGRCGSMGTKAMLWTASESFHSERKLFSRGACCALDGRRRHSFCECTCARACTHTVHTCKWGRTWHCINSFGWG